MVRPTCPHDPDIPVLALRRPGWDPQTGATGPLVGAIYGYGTHNIGRVAPENQRSPGIFGLVARELQKRHDAPFAYVPGAFGSSHRPDGFDAGEALVRMVNAVENALGNLSPCLAGPITCIKEPFTYRVRSFDEAQQDAAVRAWCERWFDPSFARLTIHIFRDMRREMAPRAGFAIDTWLHVIRLGELAIVGIPGEMFAALGLQIRRLSPFRHTIVVGLANDEIGYIPDREGYDLGGYQTWVGLHSQLEPGTGEAMVEAAVRMLHEAYSGPRPDLPDIDTLALDDAEALQRFYNSLGHRARWLFRPIGWNASHDDCQTACADAAQGTRYDLILRDRDGIAGWAFLMRMDTEQPTLGIAVSDDWAGKGLGKQLMQRLIDHARRQGKDSIVLTHVKSNENAGALYRKLGFEVTGELVGRDGNDYWQMQLTL